jgi:hypothetical protein
MMQLLLEKKIQETTMLSEKVEMLETQVAGAEEECRGCNSSPSSSVCDHHCQYYSQAVQKFHILSSSPVHIVEASKNIFMSHVYAIQVTIKDQEISESLHSVNSCSRGVEKVCLRLLT